MAHILKWLHNLLIMIIRIFNILDDKRNFLSFSSVKKWAKFYFTTNINKLYVSFVNRLTHACAVSSIWKIGWKFYVFLQRKLNMKTFITEFKKNKLNQNNNFWMNPKSNRKNFFFHLKKNDDLNHQLFGWILVWGSLFWCKIFTLHLLIIILLYFPLEIATHSRSIQVKQLCLYLTIWFDTIYS